MDTGVLAFTIVILIFSVVVHEVCHGLVALWYGDHTAERAGRLTLNPIPHIDPFGTILLPGLLILLSVLGSGSSFFIAWAKPVPVNPLNFSDIRRGELFVSLAGIGANFGLALIGTLLYHLLGGLAPEVARGLGAMVIINLSLGLFNLLPVPPLDGSKALIALLPYELAKQFERFGEYGFFIIFALVYMGVVGSILSMVMYPLLTLLGIRF